MSRKKLTNEDGSLFVPKKMAKFYSEVDDKLKTDLQMMEPAQARHRLDREYMFYRTQRMVARLFERNAPAYNKIASAVVDDVMEKGFRIPGFGGPQ